MKLADLYYLLELKAASVMKENTEKDGNCTPELDKQGILLQFTMHIQRNIDACKKENDTILCQKIKKM